MEARTGFLVRSLLGVVSLCATAAPIVAQTAPADLLLLNGRVYTFAWDHPSPDGRPVANAPHSAAGFRPDADAVAIRGDRIVFVGGSRDARAYQGLKTRVMDLGGATVLPGLVDSHTHIAGLGEKQSEVDLIDVASEGDAVARVAGFAKGVPKSEWILGRGWDEGAWVNQYPTKQPLSDRVPDHPVVLSGLHGFAVWANRLALERAGLTRATAAPEGGEIVKDASGEPTGLLLNRATSLLTDAVPGPTDEQYKSYVLAGLTRMARDGYVAVHEAGGSAAAEGAAIVDAEGRLPVRVYAMLSVRDADLCREWLRRGPDRDNGRMLTTWSVKASYDGALGSRGARLLEDCSDRPGHRGVSGTQYGFDPSLLAELMKGGFQAAIHAIGDAGNRETLDFIESVLRAQPESRALRHRIEHAQVAHPDDFPRFARLGLVASMEPPHCVEDKTWAEARLGPVRFKGAYAWRTLRRAGARLAFNSDLIGSDHDVFYGLHAAITRRGKSLQPPGGWYPAERVSPEEAMRGYTTWNAYAARWEKESGALAPRRWADVTVLDVDPLVVGATEPAKLLDGSILATIVGGKVAYAADTLGKARK